MKRLVLKLFKDLPEIYLILAPIAWFLGLLFAFGSVETRSIEGLMIYTIYAISATAEAAGVMILIRRAKGRKVAVYLVSLAYGTFFFATAIIGILALVIVRATHPALMDPDMQASPEAMLLAALSRAMVAGSAAGCAISATTLLAGLRWGGLYLPIDPLPRVVRIFKKGGKDGE